MDSLKTEFKNTKNYIYAILKWFVLSVLVGTIGGLLASFFHLSIDFVTMLRENNLWLVFLLPIGGVAIVGMYRLFGSKGKIDTNRVIESVRKDTNIPLVMIPLIFISTVITHFFGGSAGREGAALQIGGSLGYNFGKLFRLKKRDIHIIVMSGMSAVFAALFGTPITAAIFSIEVTTVGVIHYAGLFPCVVSSIVATYISRLFKISPVCFEGINFGTLTWDLALKIMLLAGLCAILSILFCLCMKKSEQLMERFIKNTFFRTLAGGALIVLLTISLGTYDYNGAGMNVIEDAISGFARYEAPFLKILFTAITISAGFKGGEIVPTFFIGSTFGCIMAQFLGIEPSVAAAIGFVALFCGVVNCPIASMVLSVEVFGAEGFLFFAIATSVSYVLSGSFGLYKSQKIIYSKTDDEYVNMNTR